MKKLYEKTGCASRLYDHHRIHHAAAPDLRKQKEKE